VECLVKTEVVPRLSCVIVNKTLLSINQQKLQQTEGDVNKSAKIRNSLSLLRWEKQRALQLTLFYRASSLLLVITV
jgi:hypothetical protein